MTFEKRTMKTFLIIFVCLSFQLDASAQAEKATLSHHPDIQRALELRAQGDLLWASEHLRYISTFSKDSLVVAEALYWRIETGDQIAEQITSRLFAGLPYIENADHPKSEKVLNWGKRRHELIEKDLSTFKEVGVEIVEVHAFEMTFGHNDREIYNKLTDLYARTEWAERAKAERVWKIGRSSFNNELAIEAGLSFLEQYPSSKFRSIVYSALGCGYSDEWELSRDNIYAEPQDVDHARLKAIHYYQLLSAEKPANEGVLETVRMLENKEYGGGYCFFSD